MIAKMRCWATCLGSVAVISACGDSSGPDGIPQITGTYSAIWEVEARDIGGLLSCTGEVRISSQVRREASGTYERFSSTAGCTAAKGLVSGEVHEEFLTLRFARLDGSKEDFGIGAMCVVSISEDIPLIGFTTGKNIAAESTIRAQCPNPVSLENTLLEILFTGSG